MKRIDSTVSIAAVMLLGFLLGISSFDQVFIIDAQALIDTQGNVAEIARQTALKNVRNDVVVGQRFTTLPVGYTTVVVKDKTYYVHNNVYYKAYYEGNRVVYFVVEKP